MLDWLLLLVSRLRNSPAVPTSTRQKQELRYTVSHHKHLNQASVELSWNTWKVDFTLVLLWPLDVLAWCEALAQTSQGVPGACSGTSMAWFCQAQRTPPCEAAALPTPSDAPVPHRQVRGVGLQTPRRNAVLHSKHTAWQARLARTLVKKR